MAAAGEHALHRQEEAEKKETSSTHDALAASLPQGKRKHDEFFGDVDVYRGAVTIKLPIAGSTPRQDIVLVADSQGCADVGVCYPPTRQQVRLVLPSPGAGPGPQVEAVLPRKGLFN